MRFFTAALVLGLPLAVAAQPSADSQLAPNPFVTHLYTADPSAHVWQDGRLYVYPSHDVDPPRGCDLMDRYHVFSTDDMVHWRDHGEILNSGQVAWGRKDGGFMWAPDCAYKDGKYYFYFPHPSGDDWNRTWKVGVAVSTKPDRNFQVVGYIEGLGDDTFAMIDPCVFVDEDGQAYFYYGGGGRCVGARLKDNMTELAEPLRPMEGLTDFHEATWVHRRGDWYYLSYADNHTDASGRGANRMHYAMGRTPMGPWQYKGILLEPTGCDTSHGSIAEYKGEWYLFYHNQALSGQGNLRSICADRLNYNADGTIQLVKQTLGRSYTSAHAPYDTYRGLAMAGYQGWFGAPDDGAGRGWYHYVGRNGFRPGSSHVDLLPETKEYKKLYKTEFTFDNGDTLWLPSSYDKETTELHFKWMEQYGLDGVFMQRFVSELKSERSLLHLNQVLDNAMQAANDHGRAISLMYDLSGMQPADTAVLLRDIDRVAQRYSIKERTENPACLWHNGRPLVAVWGVGFNDNRAYGLNEAEAIINGLKARGFSVLIGVPAHWRVLDGDTEADPRLLSIIEKCDVVMPWFVGRYNEDTYARYFHQVIRDDLAWCRERGIDYAPLCYPGFTWSNMHYPHLSTNIPRNKGSFFKKQLDFCIDEAGAEMLYIAMFDEIDEGTAIMKCATRVPTPADGSTFVAVDKPSDRYLKLAGQAARRIKKVKK